MANVCIKATYGVGVLYVSAGVFVVLGIMSSFQSFVFFASETIYAIAQDGLLPREFLWLHPYFNTPVWSSISAGTPCMSLVFSQLTLGFRVMQRHLVCFW